MPRAGSFKHRVQPDPAPQRAEKPDGKSLRHSAGCRLEDVGLSLNKAQMWELSSPSEAAMGEHLGRPSIYKPVSLAFSKREVDFFNEFQYSLLFFATAEDDRSVS